MLILNFVKIAYNTNPPPPPPQILLQIWASHKSDKKDAKTAEIRLSAEKSHPCTVHSGDMWHDSNIKWVCKQQ